jgi:hypothetical protein
MTAHVNAASNMALERTAGSHSLAAAAHRRRSRKRPVNRIPAEAIGGMGH